MTAAVILASVLLGDVYASQTGSTAFLGSTVYVWAFMAGLATAALFAFRSGERRVKIGAVVLILNFAGAHAAWASDLPILYSAGLDLAAAAWFVLAGATRWELMLGILFAISAGIGGLTGLDLIPDNTERAGGFIAFSFPDIAAIIGHFANALLGFSAGDSGLRLPNWRAWLLRPRWGPAA